MFSEYWFLYSCKEAKPSHTFFKVFCFGSGMQGSFDIGVFVSYWLKLNGPRFIYLLFSCNSNQKINRSKTSTCTRLLCFFNSKLASFFNIPPKFLTWISKVILCVYSVTRQPLFKCWQHTCKHDEWRQQRKLHHLAALGHHVSGNAARSDRESGVPSAAAASPLLHTADRRGGRRGWSLPGGHEPGPATAVPPSPPPPQ